MKSSIKANNVVIVFLLATLVVLAIVSIARWVVPRFQPMTRPLGHRLGTNCSMVAKVLKMYYEDLGGNVPEDPAADFITYVMNIDDRFSREAPPVPYESEDDIGFYLLLPPKLESSGRRLIAYTSPFTQKRVLYRHALFLQGTEIDVWKLPEAEVKSIVGSETFEKRKPDVYYWPRRPTYLRDKSLSGDT